MVPGSELAHLIVTPVKWSEVNPPLCSGKGLSSLLTKRHQVSSL